MIEGLKKLRVEIDKWAQGADQLERETDECNSQEVKDCVKSLYYAKAWIGKALSYLDSESPYKNDGNRKAVADIEPTDSVYTNEGEEEDEDERRYTMETHVQRVDFLRERIQGLINNVQGRGYVWFSEEAYKEQYGREQEICRANAFTHLCEARFALGFELQRLRENAE